MFPLLRLFKDLSEEKAAIHMRNTISDQDELERIMRMPPKTAERKPVYAANVTKDGETFITELSTARPGATPPKPYVNTTLEKLNKVRDDYTSERDLLQQDIDKLNAEHEQVSRALEAVSKAIAHLEIGVMPGAVSTQAELDAQTLAALYAGTN